MTRSRIKNKYNKWPSRENFLALKQIKNKGTNLTKKVKKQYFAKSTGNQSLIGKSFWNSTVSDKQKCKKWSCYYIKGKGRLPNDELEVAETINSHYINIVETTCGQHHQALGSPKDQTNDI